jgi:phosphoglucomutase
MVTASHNPAKYNGYKAYGEDGCQMTDVAAGAVYDEICKLDMFKDVKLRDFDEAVENGLIEYVADEVYTSYIEKVKEQQINPGVCKGADLKVVYTPLNGAGNKLVRRILNEIGVEDVTVVKEQEMPDGNFTTCPYPNPEIREALQKGLELCEEVQPDLLLATDPDSDRVGIAVKDYDGSYRLITGNEDGAMLTDFILSNRKANGTLPENPVVVKTIVTTKLVEKLCEKYNVTLKNVLTGFKYIGEVILNLEKTGNESDYVFGFEESYGYLAGSYVRDKDAVVASMLICEMAATYKKQGKSLAEVIDGLYEEYGYYMNTTLAFEFEGSEGMQKMADIMASIREDAPQEIAGYKVVGTADYKLSVEKNLLTNEEKAINLPKSNVIQFNLEGDNMAIVRPSGTEPKIKIYLTAVGQNKDDAHAITAKLEDACKKILGV